MRTAYRGITGFMSEPNDYKPKVCVRELSERLAAGSVDTDADVELIRASPVYGRRLWSHNEECGSRRA